MALTISKVADIIQQSENLGAKTKRVYLDVTFDSSHAAGGETLDLSKYLETVLGVWAVEDSGGYLVTYIPASSAWPPATGKLQAYYFDYNAVADGVAIVPTGVDLSGVTVRIVAEGLVVGL